MTSMVDENKKSLSPKACILNHARRRPHVGTCFSGKLNETEQAIIKTLAFLRNNGKTETVINSRTYLDPIRISLQKPIGG